MAFPVSPAVNDTYSIGGKTWKCVAVGPPAKWIAVSDPIDLADLIGTLNTSALPAFSGDVTSSAGSATLTIASSAVTLTKMANISTATFLGRNTAGTGVVEALSVATVKTLLAYTKSDIGLGSVENTALSTWAGTASLTTLGTVTTGTWTGTDIAVADGGTGRSTSTTAYGLIAAGTTATGALQTLAAGATTEILVGGGAAALPVWTTATGTGAPARAGSPTFTGTAIFASLYSSGNAGIGIATASQYSLVVGRNVTGAGTSHGISQQGVVQSDVVTAAHSFSSYMQTQATAFTLATFNHYFASGLTLGAGSTVTNQIGFRADATLTQGTNNYGFYGAIAASAGDYNLYMAGTADNFFAGRLGIGAGTAATANVGLYNRVDITGGTTAYANYTFAQVQPGVTSTAFMYASGASTLASAFTLSSLIHYYANQSTIGAGSTVTNQFGFYVESSLSGATNNYGFYGNVAAGSNRYNLYMNGTAANYLSGALGIGTLASAARNLEVSRAITGSTFGYGILSQGAVQSDVTTSATMFYSGASTQAASFTLSNLTHYHAVQATIGAGSAVAAQLGFYVDASLIGATSNYGYYGNIPAGSGRWNLYMNGTALNFMSGALLIGSSTDDTVNKLQVTGSSTHTGQIKSTLATGTAPFVVASTTLVANLAAQTAVTVTTNANLTGPVTSVGNATTIATNVVTLANMSQVATATFLGRTTAATGNVEALTVAQAKTLLALVKADVGLGSVENTALSTWAGTASLTTLGTITTGTWTGTDIAVADGGTGRSTSTTAYGLIAAGTTATGALQTLAAGATTEILVGGGAAALPIWTTATGTGAPVRAGSPTFTGTITAAAITLSTPLAIASGGTNSTATATAGGIGYGSGTAHAYTAAGNAGEFMKSTGAGTPVWAVLTTLDLPGSSFKYAVTLATTANITLSGEQTIDGTLTSSTRVLVKNQTLAQNNGIYTSNAGAWVRTVDADAAGEISSAIVAVDTGTVNGGQAYTNTFKSTDTLGTTAMNWYQILTTLDVVAVANGGTGRATSTTAYGLIAAGTTATGTHQTLAAGATTEMLVGGGAAALPIWTTATGTGAPVRAGSPTFTGTITAATVTASGAVTGSNLSGTNTGDQTITLTGNVTGTGTGSFATTIATNVVTLANMAQIATSSILGRITAATGNVEVLTAANVKTILSLTNVENTALSTWAGTANITTVGAGVITLANMANVATGTIFYRKTAATGVPEVQTLATLKTDLGLTGTNSGDQTITLTGNVTGTGVGSFATTIAANVVTLANMAQVATGTFLGRTTAATGNVEALTVAQAKTLLALVKADVGLSAVENTALSTWAGTTSVTTLGTIATGTWTGTDIAVADGGTGRSTSTTAYGLIAAGTTATGALQTLAAGATTEVLVGGGAAALPVWTTVTGTGAPVMAASPTLSGTPLSTTAAVDTNTTQIATTAFVVAQASGSNPVMNGAVAVGTSLRYARTDHVHASDTSREPTIATPSTTNYQTYSEQLDNAAWTKSRVTVTANATTGPDGSSTSDKVIATSVAGTHTATGSGAAIASTTIGVIYASSIYIKQAEYTWAIAAISIDADTYGKFINLATGAVGSTYNLAPDGYLIEAAGNGYWRVTVYRTATTTNAAGVKVYPATADTVASYTGDDVSGIYATWAQIEAGSSVATFYKPTTSLAVTVGVGVDHYWRGDKTWQNSVVPATATPIVEGTGATGVSLKYAREDHVHPSASGGSVPDFLLQAAGIL